MAANAETALYRGLICALAAVLCLTAFPLRADDPLRPGIKGADDRLMVDPVGPPWSSIGRVNRTIGVLHRRADRAG